MYTAVDCIEGLVNEVCKGFLIELYGHMFLDRCDGSELSANASHAARHVSLLKMLYDRQKERPATGASVPLVDYARMDSNPGVVDSPKLGTRVSWSRTSFDAFSSYS